MVGLPLLTSLVICSSFKFIENRSLFVTASNVFNHGRVVIAVDRERSADNDMRDEAVPVSDWRTESRDQMSRINSLTFATR